MSRDPVRLLDDPSVLPELRESLRHIERVPPVPYDAQAGLARFLDSLPKTAPVDPTPATSAGGATGLAKLGPLVLSLAIGGGIGAIVGGALIWKALSVPAPAPSETATARVVSPPEPAEASFEPRNDVVDRVDASTEAASPSASRVSSPVRSPVEAPSRADMLREEMAHVAQMRSLVTSQPAKVVQMAGEGHKRFPKGLFYQEREALAIQALAAMGRRAEARTRGEQFLRAFPSSPMAERIRQASGSSGPLP